MRYKNLKFLKIFFTIFLLGLNVYTANADMTKYCAVPPTIGYSVSPNIMLVLQDDGRMRWRAYCYDNDGDGWCDNGYDPTYSYDGYFEPDKLYRWNSTEFYWEKVSYGTPVTCPDTNNKFPIEYKETFSSGSSSYTLKYAVIRGSLKIYSVKLGSQYITVYDDGLGNLRRSDNSDIVGSITYSNSSGVGEISFSLTVKSSFDVYYGYNLNTNSVYTGSCLNYHFMTRIDIVRFLLTGGSPRSCPTSYIGILSNATPQICDPRQNTVDKVSSTEIILKTQDFEDWDLRWYKNICWDPSYCIKNYTFPGIPVKVDMSRVYEGILYKQASLDTIGKAKPRIGLITYDTAWPVIHNNKVYIGDFRTSITDYNKNFEYQHVITSLNANRDLLPFIPTTTCKTAGIWDAGNSMAPALWDVYRYFKQETPLYCGLDPSTSSDDKWKNPLYQCIDYYDDGSCKEVAQAPCSKNFVILITEGMWNIGSDSSGNLIKTCKIDDGFESLSSDPVVPIRWMHKGINMVNEGNNINIDKVYVLNIWAYSDYGKMASKLMAVYGSFDTSYDFPEGYTGYPQSTCDLSAYNSAFTDCKGSLCENSLHTGTGYSWDKNNDGIPDTYFEVNTVEDLRRALETAFSDIQKNVASSSTTALLTGRNDKGAILEQVLFYPSKIFEKPFELTWISQLFTLWYYKATNVQNIREDTNKNFKLDVLDDKVVEYYLDNNQQLNIKVCNTNSDGSASSTCQTYDDINNINYLVEVGKELLKRDYDTRKIYSVDENNQLRQLTASNKSYFDTLLGTDINEFPTCLQTDGNIDYEKTINYLLGYQVSGCRNKVANSDGDTWKLADIMHSSPQIVSYGDYDVVFVSSNDGVLHAFKIGQYKRVNSTSTVAELLGDNKGEELWGFIPKHALPYIRYLADPNYCHIYITDLRPYIVDADYDRDGTVEKVLIGGFRLGGGCGCTDGNCITPPADTCPDPTSSSCVGLSSYYALDITDPTTPVLLWEFTDPNLYFTYSGPGVIKTKDNKYHVVFASGPINYTGQFLNTNNQGLKIFVLDLETGSLERIISTGIQKAFAGRIFSEGFDFDEDGYTDYLAFGYVRQDGSDTNYKGGIILLGGNYDASTGALYPFDSNVYNWNGINYTAFGTDINPVVSKVEFMKCFGKWYMYFGTGRWFKNIDDWEVNNNTLFGIPIDIKEDSDGNKYISLITNTENMTDQNNQKICTEAQNGQIKGWYINLEGSTTDHLKEKMITDPIKTPFNVVLFATIEPVKAICGLGGRTRIWGLNCATGGVITGCTVNDLYKINPSTVQGMLLLQLSGGNIEQININNIAQNTSSRTTNWTTGIAPEGAPPFVKPYKELKGKILLWLER